MTERQRRHDDDKQTRRMPTVIAEMQCGDADGTYSLDGRYHDLVL